MGLNRPGTDFSLQPVNVIPFDKAAENLVGFIFLELQYLLHAFIHRLFKFKFPEDDLLINLHPFLVVQAVADLHSDVPEFLLVLEVGLFADDLFVFEVLLQAKQDLVWLNGFDKVIGYI